MSREDQAFAFQALGAEVQQQADREAGGPQVVQGLCLMNRGQFRHGLQFKNDFVETDEIRLVESLQLLALVEYRQLTSFRKGILAKPSSIATASW